MKYKIVTTRQFRKALKKIKNKADILDDLEKVINVLAQGELLDRKYKDHKLTGGLSGFRELHVRADVLLIYKKDEDVLVVLLVRLGSHGELF